MDYDNRRKQEEQTQQQRTGQSVELPSRGSQQARQEQYPSNGENPQRMSHDQLPQQQRSIRQEMSQSNILTGGSNYKNGGGKPMYVRGYGGDLDVKSTKNMIFYQHAPISSKSSMKMMQPTSRLYGSNQRVLF